MSTINVNHVPNYNQLQMPANELSDMVNNVSIAEKILWDGQYYYLSLVDWRDLFTRELKNMPAYTVDKFDCEDYAILLVARILERYKINGCGIAVGESPLGEHGYNVFVSEGELWIIDPQIGDIMPFINTEGYKPRIVIFS